MKDFYELFEAGKKLGKGVSELIESLSDLEPSGKVFLDCSGSKMRSGVSNWLGVSIIDGGPKEDAKRFESLEELQKDFQQDWDQKSIVLVKGSRSAAMERFVKAILNNESE